MNTDELRDALTRDAHDQPPTSPGFAAGVERRIRRQRVNAALIAMPFVVVVLLAAAVLGTRGTRDATIATADSATGTSVPPSVTTAPSTTTAPTTAVPTTAATSPTTAVATTEDPATTQAVAPASTSSSAPTTTAAARGGACGTVSLSADPNAQFETGPF